MIRVRLLLGFAALFSAAAVLNTLLADPPKSPTSKAKAEKPPKNTGKMTVTVSQKEGPTEEAIRKALEKPIEVKFQKVPLNKLGESLAKSMGINIVVDEQALTEEGVPVNELITQHGKPLAVARLLDRILPPYGLTWIIEDDAVKITTIIAAQEKLITRVYPVGDLVEYAKKQEAEEMALVQSDQWYPVQFGGEGGGFGGTSFPMGAFGCLEHQSEADWLVDTLQQLTSGPWVDLDGTGGTISYANNTLVIRQTHQMQPQCEQIIETIREFTKGDLTPNPTEVRPPHYATDEDKAVEKALTKVISVKAEDVPLEKFMADMAKTLDVPLSLDEQALSEEGVAVDEPINRDLKDLPARSILNITLEPLGLAAIVEDGQLFVTTIITNDERLTTKLHDIRGLVEAGYSETEIIDTLQQETSGPWIDYDGTGGNINSPLPGLLVIRQTYKVHNEVEAVLADLRKKTPKPAKEEPKRGPADPEALTIKFYSLLMPQLGDAPAIRKAILTMIEPDSWQENQPNAEGQIVLIDSNLVVKNRNEVHTKIKQFLKDYEAAAMGNLQGNFGFPGMEKVQTPGGGGGFFQVPPLRLKPHPQKTNE